MFGEVDDESHEQTFLFSSTARSERINFISIRCSINRLHDSTREILPTTTRTLISDEPPPPPPTDKKGRKQQRGRASTLTSLYVSSMIEEVFTADANAMYLQGCLTLLQIETLTCNHRRIILKTIAKATTERTTTMTRLCASPTFRRNLRRDVGLPRTSRHEYIRHGADMEYETTHRWVKTPSRIFQ